MFFHDMTIELDKVTTAHLEDIEVNSSRTFRLPDARAINSARSLASQWQHILRCRFSTSTNYAESTVTISKFAPPNDDER